jgi:hypothetical protein
MAQSKLTVGLDDEQLARLQAMSESQRMSAERLAAAYIEEGLRMEAHRGITFKPGPVGRRPAVMLGPDVWEAIIVYHDFSEREDPFREAAQWLNLDDFQLQVALGYYEAYKAEIDAWIKRHEEAVKQAANEGTERQGLLAR